MAFEDILMGLSGICVIPVAIVGGLMLLGSIRVLYQFQKGILFQLGKYEKTVNPGVTIVLPFLQELRVVDMRITTSDVPKQEVITKDNIPVLVNTDSHEGQGNPQFLPVERGVHVSPHLFRSVDLIGCPLPQLRILSNGPQGRSKCSIFRGSSRTYCPCKVTGSITIGVSFMGCTL